MARVSGKGKLIQKWRLYIIGRLYSQEMPSGEAVGGQINGRAIVFVHNNSNGSRTIWGGDASYSLSLCH